MHRIEFSAAIRTLAMVVGLMATSPVVCARASLQLSGFVGHGVEGSSPSNACAVAIERCQDATQSQVAGGFGYPISVASAPGSDDVYVAEVDNERLQRLTADGAFVSTVGGGVNAGYQHDTAATASARDYCAADSAAQCRAGREGDAVGDLDGPESVAVEVGSGDLYALEIGGRHARVDKYTSTGEFLWRAGGAVGPGGSDLCTAAELAHGFRCGGGVAAPVGAAAHGIFKFANQSGDLEAVDRRRGIVYLGDEHRVQELAADGRWEGEIQLASISDQPGSSVVALALDRAGDLYVVYRVGIVENLLPSERANIIREFSPQGYQVAEYALEPAYTGAVVSLNAIAVDRADELAAMGVEVDSPSPHRLGALLDARDGRLLSTFAPPIDNDGIAFNEEGRLYVATAIGQSLAVYSPTARSDVLDGRACEDSARLLTPECTLTSTTEPTGEDNE